MGYASDNPADRLAAVRESIAKVLSSQEYDDRGFRNKRAQLDQLLQLEKKLEQEVAMQQQGGGNMTSVGQIFPPA